MDWYSKLYVSDDLTEKKDKIIDKIERAAGTPGIYLITVASNEKNLLDIFTADQLLWPVMHKLCPVIIGIARSYEDAVDMAASIKAAGIFVRFKFWEIVFQVFFFDIFEEEGAKSWCVHQVGILFNMN